MQAEAAQSQNVASTSENRKATPNPVLKGLSQSSGGPKLSKEVLARCSFSLFAQSWIYQNVNSSNLTNNHLTVNFRLSWN